MTEFVAFLFEKLGMPVNAGEITSVPGPEGDVITVKLPKAHVERLLGEDRRLTKSIRVLLSAAAAARESRVVLEVREAA